MLLKLRIIADLIHNLFSLQRDAYFADFINQNDGCQYMKKKIMVVDDEPDVRSSVGQIFTVSGYSVIEGENGADCLQKLQQIIPDLIILDLMMPGLSGWDVAAKIKENNQWKHIPIVFLTAKDDMMSIGMGKIAAVDYIVKPFDVLNLKRRVEKLLKKKE